MPGTIGTLGMLGTIARPSQRPNAYGRFTITFPPPASVNAEDFGNAFITADTAGAGIPQRSMPFTD